MSVHDPSIDLSTQPFRVQTDSLIHYGCQGMIMCNSSEITAFDVDLLSFHTHACVAASIVRAAKVMSFRMLLLRGLFLNLTHLSYRGWGERRRLTSWASGTIRRGYENI